VLEVLGASDVVLPLLAQRISGKQLLPSRAMHAVSASTAEIRQNRMGEKVLEVAAAKGEVEEVVAVLTRGEEGAAVGESEGSGVEVCGRKGARGYGAVGWRH
jgi:hypothetical protein